ncbi:hypothetical protein B566_EDAN001115 [Ephemera danica]|nr:hypothetical protein B566_EDAN001115 [Ephemera danica]
MLAIILGPLFFFSSVVVLTVWLRRRKILVAVRSKRRFTAQASTGRIIHHEGEVSTTGDSNAQDMSEVLAESDGHANKLQTSLIAKLQPDNKWEIPRERLRIEQVLGEGEFGRVLKASAKDLPNIPGVIFVAVDISNVVLRAEQN